MKYIHHVDFILNTVQTTKIIIIQWNPSITDTLGTNIFSLIANSGASGIFLVGVVLRNQDVEHNVAAFFEISFALCWQGRLSRG